MEARLLPGGGGGLYPPGPPKTLKKFKSNIIKNALFLLKNCKNRRAL